MICSSCSKLIDEAASRRGVCTCGHPISSDSSTGEAGREAARPTLHAAGEISAKANATETIDHIVAMPPVQAAPPAPPPRQDPIVGKLIDSSIKPTQTAALGLETIDTVVVPTPAEPSPAPPKLPGEILSTLDQSPQMSREIRGLWQGVDGGSENGGVTIQSDASPRSKESAGKRTLVVTSRSLGSAPTTTSTVEAEKGTEKDYELIDVLGKGGMGVVYSARQGSIDRTVALKMLTAEGANNEEMRSKFMSEAVVTGDLDHPNIVPIYELGSDESGALFYAMKRVQGTPWMKVIGQTMLPENLSILQKVADAVAFAHSRGVVHRDLKPENIMLGDFGEVLLMDWGLAMPLPTFAKRENVALVSTMGGTPAYMAPEMATGPLETIGIPSDIYLLGAILFEILTGQPPHCAENVMDCLMAAAANQIAETAVTGELMNIAMRAMAKAPADRYPAVQDFQAAIRAYQSHSESLSLADRAEQELLEAQQSDDYQDFARCLFAFEEAQALWSGNMRAGPGISRTRLAYASSALRKGDFDLAASLLRVDDPNHTALRTETAKAQAERDARVQRLRRVKQMVLALVVLLFVGGTAAYVQISIDRNRADVARGQAETQRKRAEDQKAVAEAQTVVADRERGRAEAQKVEAQKQQRLAEQQTTIAQEQRRLADEAKRDEEYQAYVARIGLAAAKIEENAFDTARELLDDCPPEQRHWEWGRLRYLCDQSVRRYETRGPVVSAMVSPDGKRLVAGSWDGLARIWYLDSSNPVVEINDASPVVKPAMGVHVNAVAFSPRDGKFVATGGNQRGNFVKLWDAHTGAFVRAFEGHTDAVSSISFSADGKRLLTSSYDNTARLWDVESGRELQVFRGHQWWVWSAAFSPAASDAQQRVVTASQDGSVIVWSAKTGKPGPPFRGHAGPVYTALFSPDGRTVVSGGYDKRLLVWNPAELKPFDYEKIVKGQQPPTPEYRTLRGHTGAIRSIRFSPDGKLLASASQDNTVRLWGLASGELLKILRGHGGEVYTCDFTPDGQQLVSGGHDSCALLWSLAGYAEEKVLQARSFQGHADAILSAAFRPDGQRIVTASRDHTAKIWDVASGKELRNLDEGHAFLASTAICFPEGKRLATAGIDQTVRVWDIASGGQLLRLDQTGRAAAMAIAHDGRSIVTGSADASARLWDATNGSLLRELGPHRGNVTAVAFSPDDQQVLSADSHGEIHVWNARTGKLLTTLADFDYKIVSAAFLPDGRHLLTANTGNIVSHWDLARGAKDVSLVLKHPDALTAMSVSPDGRQALTSCEDGIVRLWDIERAALVHRLEVAGERMRIAVVSPDGQLAATIAPESGTVRLWNLRTGQQVVPAGRTNTAAPFLDSKTLRTMVWSATFTPDSTNLVTVGGNEAHLWSVATGHEVMNFGPHGAVAAASYSPDGKRIVTGSWDNSVKIWDANEGRVLLKLLGRHAGRVQAASFSPDADGRYVLTASDDKTAQLWDASSGQSLRSFVGHAAPVRSAVFSADGCCVITASEDKTARLWDTQSGKQQVQFKGHRSGLLAAAISADGRLVVTGSEGNAENAKLWNAADGRELLTLNGHTASVTAVAFYPDASRVLTGSQDGTAKLWDTKTGKEVLNLKGHTQAITSVAFSPDGNCALTASLDGTAVLWLATKSGWEALVRRPPPTQAR